VTAALQELGADAGGREGMAAAVRELALGCLALKDEAGPPVTIAALQVHDSSGHSSSALLLECERLVGARLGT
jgi:hypothetical protein